MMCVQSPAASPHFRQMAAARHGSKPARFIHKWIAAPGRAEFFALPIMGACAPSPISPIAHTPTASRNCPVFLRSNKVVTTVFTGVHIHDASPGTSVTLVIYRRGRRHYGDLAFAALLGSIGKFHDSTRAV